MQALSTTMTHPRDPFKDYEVDPKDVQFLEELAQRTEPLWGALSATIATIEAELAHTQPAGLDTSRVLPPSASQVCWVSALSPLRIRSGPLFCSV